MKTLITAAFLLFATSTSAQTSATPAACTLKTPQAPAVRGVKLGMPVDELLALFPGSSDILSEQLKGAEGYSNFGYTAFTLTPSRYTTKERFAGIETFNIRSFDRRVVGLDVNYYAFPAGSRWRNIDDLVQKFSDSLHLLSPKDWIRNEYLPQEKLKCDGFEISVSSVNDRAEISFNEDRSWEQTQKQRFAAFEDEKRRAFKP